MLKLEVYKLVFVKDAEHVTANNHSSEVQSKIAVAADKKSCISTLSPKHENDEYQ